MNTNFAQLIVSQYFTICHKNHWPAAAVAMATKAHSHRLDP